MLQYITCPITNLIFCDPVCAEDGYFYEKIAIENHLRTNNISPVTKHKMGSTLIQANQLKKLTTEFLNTNPEYKTDQFLFKKPFYLFKNEFLTLIKERNFEKLSEFTGIMLNTSVNKNKESLFDVLCIMCSDETIKYVLDNSLDYDTYDCRNLKPIHTACKYGSISIIRHLLSKNVDISCEDLYGETPLNYILQYKKNNPDLTNFISEFLSYLNNSSQDINRQNKGGLTPIHYVINHGNLELFKIFENFGINLENTSQQLGGMNMIHYAFKESKSYDLIKYLIDLDKYLDIDVKPNMPSEQLIYQNVNLTKQEKQELVLLYLNKLVHKPTVIKDFIDNQ